MNPEKKVELIAMMDSVFDDLYSDLAHELFADLQQAGFFIETVEEKTEGCTGSGHPKADMILTRFFAHYPDADSFAYGLLHSQHGKYGPFFCAQEIDRLVEQGRTESDPAGRHQIYRELENMLVEHALILPLFHEQAYGFTHPEMEDFEVASAFPFIAYERLRMRR